MVEHYNRNIFFFFFKYEYKKNVKYYRTVIKTLVHLNKQLLLEMFMLLISYLDPAVPQTQPLYRSWFKN